MRTKHKYTIALAFNMPYERVMREMKIARQKAFAILGDALPPGTSGAVCWREINDIEIVSGAKLRIIGAEIYVSDEPFTPAQIAAIVRPDTFKDAEIDAIEDVSTPIELKESKTDA